MVRGMKQETKRLKSVWGKAGGSENQQENNMIAELNAKPSKKGISEF